ncbi:MAG: hypothetical protein IKN43_11780 [Selenomonadaceae bacterium]|nr:hypothetical protein [Selenomonadaceae bacterium]
MNGNFAVKPYVYKYSELEQKFSRSGIVILVAVGYSDMNQNRKKIFYRIMENGWKIGSYINPDAIVRADTACFGEGNIVFEGVIIGAGCKLGDGNVFYSGSTLAHHSQVGNFNFLAVRSSVAGRVEIGDECFFGNNCCTKDYISISDKTLIGAGCYLDSDVNISGGVFVPQRNVKLKKSSVEIKL